MFESKCKGKKRGKKEIWNLSNGVLRHNKLQQFISPYPVVMLNHR